MKACKCDVCGAYVDKQDIPKIKGMFNPYKESSEDFTKELCYNCYYELQKFLEPKFTFKGSDENE